MNRQKENRFRFLSGPNAEQALIHKLEGGDTTITNENEHDNIGKMAGQVRDKDKGGDDGGDIRRLAAKAKAKRKAALRQQKKDAHSGNFNENTGWSIRLYTELLMIMIAT